LKFHAYQHPSYLTPQVRRFEVWNGHTKAAEDGNVHALIMFKNEEERERAMGVVKRMVERAQRLDGTCTGEHGEQLSAWPCAAC
jgi:FAD/FMN-containing dehydrogenase